MPRRNSRAELVPLSDLPDIEKSPVVTTRPWLSEREWQKEQGERRERTRLRNERRAKQRVIASITDWSVCCIPGCERPSILKPWFGSETKPGDPDEKLPVCFDHATVIWGQIQSAQNNPVIIETSHMLQEKARKRAAAEHEKQKAAALANLNGHIYFVRINGLVKVGWSRVVYDRIKSYGASAELLACYPGSRNDETNLHRQLRPALAKGREWYHDGEVIAMYLAEATKHPDNHVFEVEWTTPKTPPIRSRNAR